MWGSLKSLFCCISFIYRSFSQFYSWCLMVKLTIGYVSFQANLLLCLTLTAHVCMRLRGTRFSCLLGSTCSEFKCIILAAGSKAIFQLPLFVDSFNKTAVDFVFYLLCTEKWMRIVFLAFKIQNTFPCIIFHLLLNSALLW